MYLCALFSLSATFGYAQNYRINERTRIYTEDAPGDSLFVKADNHFAVPLSIKLNLAVDNLTPDASELFSVIPAHASGTVIARLKKIDTESDYSCRYKWRIVLGDVYKMPDLSHAYSYPYQSLAHFNMTQGPGGNFSHKDSFAYDFSMPVGSAVTAARAGVVAFVDTKSSVGGIDAKYMDKANVISILHDDGTLGNYVHLNTNGATVSEGQLVRKGDIIGYSGNTGYTSGPHLHFEVVQPALDSDHKKMVHFNWEKQALYTSVDPKPLQQQSDR